MKKAFTIFELLVCIAIVAVLASLLFPVLGKAKKRANGTRTASNMRQCYVALGLYEAESGAWPDYDQAVNALKKAPTKDPDDVWKQTFGKASQPMIYSYAYIRGVRYSFGPDKFWKEELNERAEQAKLVPLLASVWQSEPQSIFVSSSIYPEPGEPNTDRRWFHLCTIRRECFMPPRVNFIHVDGHASAHEYNTNIKERAFLWDHLFRRAYQ